MYFEGVVVFIPFQIEITLRGELPLAGRVHCDQTTISSQTLLYGGNLVCHINVKKPSLHIATK